MLVCAWTTTDGLYLHAVPYKWIVREDDVELKRLDHVEADPASQGVKQLGEGHTIWYEWRSSGGAEHASSRLDQIGCEL
eukprot:366061-Chlamydomonas_euryale.AAC.8